jgi:hypothetical protein
MKRQLLYARQFFEVDIDREIEAVFVDRAAF